MRNSLPFWKRFQNGVSNSRPLRHALANAVKEFLPLRKLPANGVGIAMLEQQRRAEALAKVLPHQAMITRAP